jgi:HAE1 family hydrophobic/amphiphilic exporter-1
VDATGVLEAEVAPPPRYEDVLADAFAHRPELATSDHTRRAQMELVKINGAYDRPRLDLQGAYGVKNVEVFDQSSRGKTWNLGLVLSFPFFDGLKTRAKVAQARSDVRTTELAEKQLRDGIALEVRLAVDQAAKSAEIVRALSSTVAQAERLLTMAEKGYEFGVKTKLEVDDAQLNLRTARGNLASAQRDYRVALTNLDWVAGTLGETPTGS